MSTPSILNNAGVIRLLPDVTATTTQSSAQSGTPKKTCSGGCHGCSSDSCGTSAIEKETQKDPVVVKTVTTTWFSQDQFGRPIRTTTTTYFK